MSLIDLEDTSILSRLESEVVEMVIRYLAENRAHAYYLFLQRHI